MSADLNTTTNPRFALRFLGTAGARFTVIRQARASGGMWVGLDGSSWVIDPGPGALVRLCEAIPPLDPEKLDAILLTHRHIDHSTDVNVLVEAMTGGGRTKRGVVLLPHDALSGGEPVLYRYLRDKVERIVPLEESQDIDIPGSRIVPVRLIHHGVDCFGFLVRHPETPPWGVVSDTRFFSELPTHYEGCELLVLNVTLRARRESIDHLCLDDVRTFAHEISPRLILLTHLGRGILEEGPQRLAETLSTEQTRVLAAEDGMIVDLSTLSIVDDGMRKAPLAPGTEMA